MLRKLLLSLVLLGLLAALFWPPVQQGLLRPPLIAALDRQAEAVVDAGLKRALASFALARGLNAVISAAQGTEVQLAPAGLGVTLTPGQVLDPVNDLVEQFSWVMLASATALGVQKFLLAFGAWLCVALLLSLALLALLTALWRPPDRRSIWYGACCRLLVVALLLRLALPGIALANQGIYQLFLEPDYLVAKAGIETGAAELDAGRAELSPPAADPGFWERMKESGRNLEIRPRLELLQQRAAALVEHVLKLILVFVLDTILLPLAFLWGLWRLLRGLLGGRAAERVEHFWRQRLAR
ncbi:MAG: hypothetical protein IH613_05375 [Desulfuromonadales bacterium]|nr:hypothetical protein [Desulfuromonadales bacterium]